MAALPLQLSCTYSLFSWNGLKQFLGRKAYSHHYQETGKPSPQALQFIDFLSLASQSFTEERKLPKLKNKSDNQIKEWRRSRTVGLYLVKGGQGRAGASAKSVPW